MARWLPICPPVLSSICIHLPSAVKGQKQGVDGQLMIQVGRLLIPSSFNYFYALGRVMSGRAEKDQLVCVLNDGKESWKKLKAVMLIGGNRANEIESASAGFNCRNCWFGSIYHCGLYNLERNSKAVLANSIFTS
ncbi:hypothetical protein M3Y97_01071400 [Aphelenchoides bicaudatus]|nr:hypothetical protein M3Y97_01071400 [Aphelenchoides bicaudatus]